MHHDTRHTSPQTTTRASFDMSNAPWNLKEDNGLPSTFYGK
jgi:hypothetical protein